MKKLEKYFEQFEQLLQKIIAEGEIDAGIEEYEPGDVMISMEQPDRASEKNYFEFINIPIQLIERTEDSIERFSEDESLITLSEYIQDHPEFQAEISEQSEFSEYIVNRFRNVAQQITDRLNKGMQVPFLKRDDDPSKRVAEGHLVYKSLNDKFLLSMNDGTVEDKSVYDAMPLVFNYLYQRRMVHHFEKEGNAKGISQIPVGYRESIRYVSIPIKVSENKGTEDVEK